MREVIGNTFGLLSYNFVSNSLIVLINELSKVRVRCTWIQVLR